MHCHHGIIEVLASNFKRLEFKASTIPLFFTWPNVHVKKVDCWCSELRRLKFDASTVNFFSAFH